MSDALPPPIPAATLVLMRAGANGGAPELLMIERARDLAFAAGALAFPGGRIDPEDVAAARPYLGSFPDAPARIAAIRETIEETGIIVGLTSDGGAMTPALQNSLTGREFELDALTPFARWCPNFDETRRFDTLFYLAEAPPDAEPVPDQQEAVRAFWTTAAKALSDHEAGNAHMIFPTRRNLERLARFASIREARADAARHPVERITPWVDQRGGEPWLCIPENRGYPITAERLSTARRF